MRFNPLFTRFPELVPDPAQAARMPPGHDQKYPITCPPLSDRRLRAGIYDIS